ncbi:MAG TPA: hypothetical protein ENK82_05755 [Campylobacterales bacterium]|nr:hypothetical protein [Campylobacterales bacterium]HHS92833.1 hypothetical protein [Campylobacterales bacterium]
MSKKLMFILFILLSPHLLLSLDSNMTLIMHEATDATKELQLQMNEEINASEEIPNPIDIDTTTLMPSEVIEIEEVNTTIIKENNLSSEKSNEIKEIRTTIDVNQTIIHETNLTPVELNESNEPIQTAEVNQTIIHETNLTPVEINQSNKLAETVETNESVKEMTTVLVKELNSTQTSLCEEIKMSQENNESNLSHQNLSNECSNKEVEEEEEGTVMRGLIIYKTRIKPFCEITGEEFAKKYIQEDWDEIYHDKEFKEEVIKACPKIKKRYKDKWTPHLYQFALEYASDSDAIPEC